MNAYAPEYLKLLKHPFKFRFFLLLKLPAAFFSGVRIKEVDERRCVTTIPFKWLTQNPFRSTYFASLSMAAELSTGSLAIMQVYKRKPAVSMLVVSINSSYFKKAIGRTTFTCEDGEKIIQAIDESVATGEGRTVVARSTGKNKNGEVVAEFEITWSFKVKKQ